MAESNLSQPPDPSVWFRFDELSRVLDGVATALDVAVDKRYPALPARDRDALLVVARWSLRVWAIEVQQLARDIFTGFEHRGKAC